MSTSNRGMFTAHYKKHYVDSEKKQYFQSFVWLGAEGERHRHGEKTWRRETRHIDLKGFSPYIAVRSTLQPPLEREHVVNTSSSGQSLLSDFTLTGCIRACNQKLRRCFKNVNECWKNPRQFFQFISFFDRLPIQHYESKCFDCTLFTYDHCRDIVCMWSDISARPLVTCLHAIQSKNSARKHEKRKNLNVS